MLFRRGFLESASDCRHQLGSTATEPIRQRPRGKECDNAAFGGLRYRHRSAPLRGTAYRKS